MTTKATRPSPWGDSCKKELALLLLLLVASVACVFSAVFLDPSMFQRSGSILTAAAAWAFVLVGQARSKVEVRSIQMEGPEIAEKRLEVFRCASKISNASCILTILGTIIWGYGDLILPLLKP